jgi:transcriptional regulator with XRE-family HTH domain
MRIEKVDLGVIVKEARNKKGLTQDNLAEIVDIGSRHIQGIENEGANPSYDLLYKIVRELNIPPDSIFYPEKSMISSTAEELIRMIYKCDEKSIKIIYATAQAILGSQENE